MNVVLLAGGTGAAKLAVGFQEVLAPGELTVIANTGDDLEHWGVHVSPDLDLVLYRLAGIFDETAGYGLRDDTFAVFDMMARLGEPAWFRLGDRDLAVCALRTELVRAGARQSQAGLEICRRLGIPSRVLPMSDEPVRTVFDTELGRLAFQEYFVRERCVPRLHGFQLEGIEAARPSPEALAAIRAADLVVIGPSNPLISVGPILAVLGDLLPQARTLAVSPIVGGVALKGPTIEMLRALGKPTGADGVAWEYRRVARWYMLDTLDAELRAGIEEMGFEVMIGDTVMGEGQGRARLAASILEAVGAAR